ncbi:hypothetical protein A2U01_0028779, partial [Trifolium medium]|nr:hypothetical protein [Trifolium medium]
MSNSPKSSPIATEQTSSPSKDVLSDTITHAVPLTTILPQSSTKKKAKSSVKKEKVSKVSETTSPPVSIKKSKSKSKKMKSKVAPKITLYMSDLYLSKNPFESINVESIVAASDVNKTVDDVEASGKASGTL